MMRFAVVCLVLVAACSDDDDTGGVPSEGSSGCGESTSLASGTYVERMVDGRQYFIRLPNGYDPSRPYPTIFEHHGCSSSANRETNVVPLAAQVGDDAIIVRGRAEENCWDTNVSSDDFAYADAVREDVSARYCVDEAHRYLAGYSSGAFMANALACARGEHFRGVAVIAGGGAGGASCTPNVAALVIHDQNDGTVNISNGRAARDAYADRNGCSDQTSSVDPSPCVAYAGCEAPVLYCETTGRDHDRQDAFAAPVFWDFFASLN
jgi:polyhydroxybutyrate depolymerase